MTPSRNWKEFWAQQTSPLQRHQTPEWYALYANELNLLLRTLGYKGGAVLDSGCGNGVLFDFLEIDRTGYTGVDFSESLLGGFRHSHPELSLVCADAANYCNGRSYSLILANGLIQYFTRPMLETYLTNCSGMLERGGMLLMASIPLRPMRIAYYSRQVEGRPAPSLLSRLKIHVALRLRGDLMGRWYDPSDFEGFADRFGRLMVFGSLLQPYRFSVALVKAHEL